MVRPQSRTPCARIGFRPPLWTKSLASGPKKTHAKHGFNGGWDQTFYLAVQNRPFLSGFLGPGKRDKELILRPKNARFFDDA